MMKYRLKDIPDKSLVWKNLKNWQVIIGGLSLIIFLYSNTLGRYPIPFADSLELMTAGRLGSLAHPPGYAVQSMFLHIIMILSPVNQTALVANLWNAGLHILTLGVIGLIISILGKNSGLSKFKNQVAIVITIWFVGLGRYFWFSAGVFEVFGLNNLLVVSLIYLGLKIVENNNRKYYGIIWGIIGTLSLGHQQLSFLVSLPILIGLIVWAFRNKQLKLIKYLLIGLLMGTVISGCVTFFMGIRGNENLIGWRMKEGWLGLWSILTRADYTGNLDGQDFVSNAYWKGLNLNDGIKGSGKYILLLIKNYGLTGIVLMIWSGYSIWIEKKGVQLKFLFGLWLISGLGLAIYLPIINSDIWEFKIEAILIERLYLQGYVLAGLIIGVGIITLLKITNQIELKLLVLLLISSVLGQGLANYEYADVSKFNKPWEDLKYSLNKLPPDSILLCFGDWSCFGTIYAQSIENIRDKVIIVPVTPQIRTENLTYPELRINYPDNPWRISEFVGWARLSNRSIAIMEINDKYIDWLGLKWGNGSLSTDENGISIWNCSNEIQPEPIKNDLNYIGQTPAHEYLRIIKQANIESGELLDIIKGTSCPNSVELHNRARVCKSKNETCALSNYLQAVMLSPNDVELRLDFGEYLLPISPELAKREYKLVLSLDKDNEMAKARLKEMINIVDLPWIL